ncbi:type II secretion system protein GspL [Vibrio hippocampi]|uniref:Type II secretion system protein L n=1 Tax=Vibrio hippocampi TaxID=654686 RepID=A0ABN8DC47_9VIBR|nr:type II secretion system protein GspL [Vibrio hippocampi]CAH0524376.1 Type II secretion system protein L [Vibrio hippocampi]
MSEFLTVRLNSQPNSPVDWAVWSTNQQEMIASGSLESIDLLDSIKEYAQQRVTLVMLSGQDVHFSKVEIPAGGARQFETMLPYLVEDDVAQDVDDLHFTVLHKHGTSAQICAVDRDYLTSLLATFAAQGMDVKKVVPDVLTLPESQHTTAVDMNGQWVLRTDKYAGMVVEQDWLAAILSSDVFEPRIVESSEQEDDSHEPQKVVIESYSSVDESIITLSEQVTWQLQPVELPMAVLSKGVVDSAFNLLSGEFKPKASFVKHWKVWQKVAVAASILLVALIAKQVVLVNQYESQAALYRAESERIFRAIFPDKQRIPTVSYLKGQMTSELSRLGGSDQSSTSVLEWLSQLPKTVGKVNAMQVESFTYDGNRNEVRMDVTAKDFISFETAKNELEAQFTVTQGPLNKNGDRVMGNFVLKKK